MNYFLSNKLFSNKQFGFIKGRSCMLQLLNILSDWSDTFDLGGQIDVIYTDFEKAFDKVPHCYLLNKLKCYGISKLLINWIESFLFSRTQQVHINGAFSSCRNVLSGIPQGTVLGPLLFIIFINDLPEACQSLAKLFLFADDAKLYKSVTSLSDSLILNQCCQKIFDWSNNCGMMLNVEKCKFLHISKHKTPLVNSNYSFVLENGKTVLLENVLKIKDLGVTIENDLTFDTHIYDKIKIANKMLGIINRNFSNLDKVSFVLLYKSLVRSHLEYANSIWSPYKCLLIKDIENV